MKAFFSKNNSTAEIVQTLRQEIEELRNNILGERKKVKMLIQDNKKYAARE